MINVVLPHPECTYISSENPDTNFAASNYLYVGTDKSGSDQHRIILSFDLSLLPTDIKIESAVLKMYADYYSDKSSVSCLTPYLITSCWEETDVTWSLQPGINQTVYSDSVLVTSSEWYTWDITNMVEAWMNKNTKNYGLMIKSSEDKYGDLKRFQSSRGFYYKNLRPILEIDYDFKNRFLLSSRNTINNVKKHITEDNLCFSAWQNTSIYSTYTFFVQNTGTYPAEIYVQISPDMSAIFEEQAVYTVVPGYTEAIVPQRYGFYSRLALKSYLTGRKTSLTIWFQAQV